MNRSMRQTLGTVIIGEEYATRYGGARVRAEAIERRPEYEWAPNGRQIRKVRVTYLNAKTGEAEEQLGAQYKWLKAHELGELWKVYAAQREAAQANKAQRIEAAGVLRSALDSLAIAAHVEEGHWSSDLTITVRLGVEPARQLAAFIQERKDP